MIFMDMNIISLWKINMNQKTNYKVYNQEVVQQYLTKNVK